MSVAAETGLDFLRRNQGRRCGGASAPPTLFGMGGKETGEEAADRAAQDTRVDLGYEVATEEWAAIAVTGSGATARMNEAAEEERYARWIPCRFVDGKDVGRIAAWLETPDGFPLPVRVGQVGAAALAAVPDGDDKNAPPLLMCESRAVERVVALEADFFPWEQVESFAAALYANNFRLLIPRRRRADIHPYDFGALHDTVSKRTTEEMFYLESRAARGAATLVSEDARVFPTVPTVLDGRLEDKAWGFAPTAPVVGVIKKHAKMDYLHPLGGQVFFRLRPGERTPLFAIERSRLSVVTWYLRTDALSVSAPNEGIVRVELPRAFFEETIGRQPFDFVNYLSRRLLRWRTRDGTYERAAVTLLPIQRAEEALGAHFTDLDRVIRDFYRLTQL